MTLCEHGHYINVREAPNWIDLTIFEKYISIFCPDCGKRIDNE